ncbi:FEZ-like protein [Globodera pallida]|nr:FEZ-like protein [Globodera pallida]
MRRKCARLKIVLALNAAHYTILSFFAIHFHIWKLESDTYKVHSHQQDAIESFDDKVTTVLKDLDKDAEKIAPVKIRSQEEIMSESQFWWTLTGNYGNLPPIDFDRSQIRRKQLEALNFQSKEGTPTDQSVVSDGESEDPERLDFHRVATSQLQLNENGEALPFSADKVIEEIDEILQAGDLMNQSLATNRTIESVDSMYSSMRSPNVYSDIEAELKSKEGGEGINVSVEEMNSFAQSKLITIVSEMEQIIQLYNEELVRELARKDELEYEKEVRNKFITLLVAVQERRRKLGGAGKKQSFKLASSEMGNTNDNPGTVSIPYDDSQEGPNISALEWLVKILQAMTDDSVQLPTLLTEYILNVVCPSKYANV